MAAQKQRLTNVAKTVLGNMEEAKQARQSRMDMNLRNFDCYHLKQDYSHKLKGQSREFLSKQQQAVDQIATFTHQGLMDLKDWFDIEPEDGVDVSKLLVTPPEQKKILNRQLDKNDFFKFVSDSIKVGLLGSLMICKVRGEMERKSLFEARQDLKNDPSGRKKKLMRRDNLYWRLKLDLVRQEDFYPDPTGSGLYNIQAIDMDYHDLLKLAKDNPGVYDMDAVTSVVSDEDTDQKTKKSRETNQDTAHGGMRKRVRIFEQWGTLLHPKTHEVMMDNSVCAITSDGKVIRPPAANPFWHGEDPYVVCPIITVPWSVWHRALMDAATGNNIALNEIYNLMVDGGMQEVFGIKQIRTNWLNDPSQVADGIPAGTTLDVNTQAPPGAKVLERVDVGSLSPQAFNMYNMMDREFSSSSMSNDIRMGNLPQRQVKATEIMASNQTLNGLFSGVGKHLEANYISKILRKSWLLQAQNLVEANPKELDALIGTERSAIVRSYQNEDIFASTAEGQNYKVYGISSIMNKLNDFKKLTTLLQTISGSPDLVREFTKKFSFTKFMGEIIKSLDINEDKIKLDDQEKAQIQAEQQQAMQLAMAQAQGGGGGGQGGQPDHMSQVPQMASQPDEQPVGIPRGDLAHQAAGS